MEKEVVVLDADKKQRESLCALLADNNYKTASMRTLSEMEAYVGETDFRVIILNLDNTSINNKNLRELKRKKPFLNIIALSERQFHPELEEALREYISACLAKPVDPDELIYWLNSIFESD